MIVVIMGVSGAGKTTVGRLLAKELGWNFCDADDFHSAANKDKMSRGVALTDEDRADWLISLRQLLNQCNATSRSVVLTCSALKQEYRNVLRVNNEVHFVYLQGSHQQIEARMKERKGHYMKPEMLKSQFEILEEPKDALTVDISQTPKEIIKLIHNAWNL
jgi:gluconokinase